MATLNLSNGIRMNNPEATGTADSFLPNANAGYGPHQTLETAKRAVSEAYGGNVPLGVTVAVKVGSVIKEYWNPSAAETFIEKQSAGGGGSIQIETIDGVVEDTTTWLDTTFPSMTAGGHVVDTSTGKVYIKYNDGWVVMVGTILTNAVPTVTRIANAQVLSYK